MKLYMYDFGTFMGSGVIDLLRLIDADLLQ